MWIDNELTSFEFVFLSCTEDKNGKYSALNDKLNVLSRG